MEGAQSDTLSELAETILANLDTGSLKELTSRANSLGLPVRPGASVERIVSTLAKAVANLLDEISPEGEAQRRRREGSRWGIEGHSTLNNAPNCTAGNLNIAALAFTVFCPRLAIWDVLDLLSAAREQLLKEEPILEEVRLRDRIRYLPNMRSSFSCHCLVFDQPHTEPPQATPCASCGKDFHGECQPNPLFCNCCFLRFCLFDVREQLGEALGQGREVEQAYFTYLENHCLHSHTAGEECTYFHLARFNLPEINNLEKKEKAFFVKLALVDQFFSNELAPPGRTRRRREPRTSWELEGTEYSLFLNHNEIKITNALSDYAVLFKLIPRVLLPNNNILVLKCVKRNLNYLPPTETPYWQPGSEQEPHRRPRVVMMGVYQTSKVRSKHPKPTLTPRSILPELTLAQSVSYLRHVLTRINQIQYQIVDLLDVDSHDKIVIPVRSYSCSHVECFDYEEFRMRATATVSGRSKVMPNNYRTRSRIRKRTPIDVDQDCVIDLDSHSEEAKTAKKPPVLLPPLTPLQRSREFLRRKRQRERREKDELFCPICNKRMLALYVDPLFKSILLNAGFYSRVRVYANGEFHFDGARLGAIA